MPSTPKSSELINHPRSGWSPAQCDAQSKRMAKWRAEHPEVVKALNRKWKLANPTRWRAHIAKAKLRRRNVPVEHAESIADWYVKWKKSRRVRCYWCNALSRPSQCHVDHIKAIALGGAHAPDNLCISCAPCNLKKNAKPVAEWSAQLQEPVLL